MNPSNNWLPMADRADGLSYRVGANGDLSDPDYINYPPFAVLNANNGGVGEPHFITWKINDGTFPLNQSINDWTVAYTAVNNSELSMNNIGVFISSSDDPDYLTDNTQHQQIAFFTSWRFKIIYNNLYNIQWQNLIDFYRFRVPNANDMYCWSPSAKTTRYSDYNNLVLYLSNINYQGFAIPYENFGIKSIFLEIYVIPVQIGNISLGSYDISLKEYSQLTDEAKESNPIACAYVRVHRRGNTNGSYTYNTHDNADMRPVMSIPFSNGQNNVLCYFSQVNLMNYANVYFPLWGNSFYNPYVQADTNNGCGDFFYGYDKISGKIVTDNHDGTFKYQMYMDGTDENLEYLRKCCAAYGLFFCDDIYTDDNQNLESDTLENNNQRWLHEEMHLGIIEENGYTEGRYTSGVENGLQDQFNWKETSESSYDPDLPPEPENTYSTQTVFNQIGDLTTMTHRYVLESGAVENLGTALWDITDFLTNSQTDYSELNQKILDTFQSSNPIDCIVSLQRYPLNIPKADSTLVKLGNYETVIAAHTMEKTVYVYLFEMKNPILPLFYDSFLDYEPYTHFELYVPFCGTTAIEPADVLNRKLAVQLVVDFTTGTCTGYIMSDNLVIKTVNGQIAIDIPVSGLQQITAASQINNAIATAAAAQKQEIAATLGTVSISGITSLVLNPVKTLTNGQIAQINAQKAEYDLQHQNIQPHIIGAATSAAAWAIDLNCRLLIYYPTGEVITETNPPAMNGQKLAEYGHTIGFACCLTGQLQDFLGLTVAVNADLNGITTNGALARPATAQELQMLEAALNEGIII